MTRAGSRVWQSQGFRRYWTALAVSLVGDQVSLVAIPLVAVTLLQATSAQMGLLRALGQAPVLVFGLLAGVWVDRVARRRLLVACDLGRALVIGLVPLAAVAGFLSLPLLLTVVFAAATLGVVFGMAAPAFLPELVRRDQLLDANAKLTQPRALAQVAGPGLAGALVQVVTAPVAIVLDAVSYLASAALLRGVRVAEPPARQSESARPSSVPVAIRQGVSYVWRNPLLRASAATAGTYNLFNAAVLALLVLYLARSLRLTAFEIGLVLAVVGPGALLGAALAVPAARWLGVGPAMIAGLVAAGAGVLAVPLAAGAHAVVVLTLLAAMFLNGLGQPLYNVNQTGLRQAIVPVAMQGRVQATLTVFAGGAAPIGALGGGLAGEWLGIHTALLIAGAGTTLACVWLLCSPVRGLARLPSESAVSCR